MDLEKWAKFNRMTSEEFQQEVLNTAVVLAVMAIGKSDGDIMTFTTSDDTGPIQLTVKRITPDSREVNDE